MMKLLRCLFFIGVMVGWSCKINAQTNIKIAVHSSSHDTICSNGNTQLVATVTGCSSPTYQWYRNGVAISSGGTGSTISLNAPNDVGNGDTITCRQTNNTSPCTLDTSNFIRIFYRPNQNIQLTSAASTTNQSVCQYSSIQNITYNLTGLNASNISVNNLPPGITYKILNNVLTISGTPTSVVNNITYQIQTTGGCGNSLSLTGTFTSNIKPDASIADYTSAIAFTNCSGTNFDLKIDNTSTTQGTNANYKIDWGDNSPIYSQSNLPNNTSHLYTAQGYFNLVLTITGSNGCIATKNYSVYNGSNPQVPFPNPGGSVEVCLPFTYLIPSTATSNPVGTIYVASTNDGSQNDTMQNPPPANYLHTFTSTSCGAVGGTNPNSFFIRIKAYNQCLTSGSGIDIYPITTVTKPKADFVFLDSITCINKQTSFINKSKSSTFVSGAGVCDTVTKRNWVIYPSTGWVINNGGYIGDPSPTFNPSTWGSYNIDITFTSSGVYTVSLILAGKKCGSDTITKTICVNLTPTASFTTPKDTLCAGENLIFTNTSNTPLCGNNIYSWSIIKTNSTGCNNAVNPTFVSGSSSSANPVLNFSQAGSYDVSLTTSISGTNCTTISTPKTIIVKDKPNVTLNTGSTQLCQGDVLQPTVTTGCYVNNATYNWTFTNATPASSSSQTPGTINFNSTGTSLIKVDVTNVCGTTSNSQSITIYPKPTVDTIPDFTLCAGDNFAQLNFSGTVAGTTYSWSGSAGNIGLPAPTPDKINSFTATNTTISPITVTITITSKKGNCPGASRTFTITVNPKPTIDPVSNITQCAGTTVNTIAFTGALPATTFNWTNNNTSIGLAASGSGDIAAFTGINNTTTAATANVVVTPSKSGCNGTPTNFNITIKPVPKITDTSVVQLSQCGGNNGSITLKGLNSGSGYTISYQLNGVAQSLVTQSASGAGFLTLSNLTGGTYSNIFVRFASGNCPSNIVGPITISDPSKPSAPDFNAVTICSGNNLALNALNPIGGAIYTWTKPNNATATGISLTVNNIAVSQGGNYSLTVTVNGCTSVPVTKNITVNQTPSKPTVTDKTYCQNAAATALSASGANIIWYDNVTLNNGSLTAPIPSTSAVGSTIYYLLDSNNAGCKSPVANIMVTIKPTPNISSTSKTDPTQCASPTGSITLNGLTANTTYKVSYNGAVQATVTTTTTSLTITGLAAGTYSNISVILDDCPSNTISSVILNDPTKPATPVITANTPICSGNTLNLSAATSSPGTATYKWLFKDGSTPTGATQSITSITVAKAGVYQVSATINQCKSNDTTITITVNQTPSKPVTADKTYCQNATATALSVSGANIIWYDNATLNNGSLTAPTPGTATIGTTTYYVIDSSNAGCKSDSASIRVTINPTPVISNLIKNDPSLCNATDGKIKFDCSLTGNFIIDFTKNGIAQSPVSATVSGGSITLGNLGKGTYDNIKITSDKSCISNIIGPITLSDPNKPATPVITGNASICAGNNLTLTIQSPVPNGIYNWTHPSGTPNTGSSITVTNIQKVDSGSFAVTVTDSGCTSDPATKFIIVKPLPTLASINNIEQCNNTTIAAINFNGNSSSTVYSWTNTTSSIGLAGSGTGNIAAFTAINTTANTIISTINITTDLNGCPGETKSFTIAVNPTPVIGSFIATDPSQCSTNNTGSIKFNCTVNDVFTVTYYKSNAQQTLTNISPVNGIIKIPGLYQGTYDSIKVISAKGCVSNVINGVVLTDPTPPATPVITGVDTVCSSKIYSLIVQNPLPNYSYTFTHPNGTTLTDTIYNFSSIGIKDSGVYKLYVIYNQCRSKDTTFSVRVDSTPMAPMLSGNTPVCTDSTIRLFATSAHYKPVTYTWAGVNGFISTQQNPTILTATVAMDGYYNAYVTSVTGKCSSAKDSTKVIINETPHISFKDSIYPNKCATATGYIRLNGLKANTVYSITYIVGSNIVSQSQQSDAGGVLKIDTLRAGVYSDISVTLNACPSNKIGSYTLLDPDPPAAPVITGIDSICSGNSFILNATSPIPNAIYTWTHPNGTKTNGTSYTINAANKNDSGTYRLYVTLNLCQSKDTMLRVRVDSTPLTPMLSANSPVCTGNTVLLTGTTSHPLPVTFNWAGVNGFTSTQQNPSISTATLAMAGYYNAYITSITGKCSSPKDSVKVVINPTPDVMQVNDTTYKDGANSGNIAFGGTVTGTTFNWTNSNPSIGLAANGNGTINFTATNTTPFVISGLITVTPSTPFCTGTPITFKITVNPTPTLSSKLKDTICTDNLYTYQATSSTPNVKYTWGRNAVAGISNAASASTDSTGAMNETLINNTTQPVDVTYNFKLYSLGSVNTVPFILTITPNAKAAYTFTNDRLCTPAYIDTNNIKVMDFPEANGSYEWYADGAFIGTGINFPGYTISNNGDTVYIKLQAISRFGCKPDTFVHKFYTVKTPTVSFTKSIAKDCGPLHVDFTNTSTLLNASTYYWDFGNGQTSTQQSPSNIIFNDDISYNRHDTTYYIILTAITQCDTIKFMDSVTVLPKPRALFQPNATVGCSVFKFIAFNNSLGTHNNYTWNFGDSTPLVTDTVNGYYYHDFRVTKTDTFYVKLKAQNNCGSDSFIVNVVVYPNTIVPKLIVDGTNNYGCAPTNIKFINNTRGANKFTVNFGDGSLPYFSINNPDTIYHYYQNGGVYFATLKAENTCTDSTVTVKLNLYNKPKAGFITSKSDYCVKENISFINTSDTGLSYEWKFTNINISTQVNPSYIFNTAGVYTVLLIAKSTNATGAVCTDTVRKTITIHSLPDAGFNSNAVLNNCQPYQFVGQAPNIMTNIYSWHYYDITGVDTTSAGNVGSHIFYKPGNYVIRLIVTNSFSCSDTSFAQVKIIETPKPNFSLNDSLVCTPGKTINFINSTIYSAPDPVNYEWYVNNILQSTNRNFSYSFTASINITAPVVYLVKLVSINAFGCRDSIIKKIIIQPKALAAFVTNATQGCVPYNLQFSSTSKFANIYRWYVDGNLFSSSISPGLIVLSQPNKTYTIKLFADNTLGCGGDSTVLLFNTYPKPVADFKEISNNTCTGKAFVNLFDNSYVLNGNITKWLWNFGNGIKDTNQNPVQQYTVPGLYNISLTVKDNRGCTSDPTTNSIKNFGKPTARFTVADVCKGTNVIPVNLSSAGFGSTGIASYTWDFGDGFVTNGSQPVHPYMTEGVYNIRLIVTSDSSCVPDTIVNPIKIFGSPKANFTVSNNCINTTANFTNTSYAGFGQPALGSSKWKYGNGTYNNVLNGFTTYNATGTYNVTLAVTGSKCPALIDSLTLPVQIFKARDGVSYPLIQSARTLPLQLNAMSGGVNYLWQPKTGIIDNTLQNPVANYTAIDPAKILYTITIEDSFGCRIKDTQQVWLFNGSDVLLPTAFTPNGDRINDLFIPLYIGIQKLEFFRIFDRWGKLVFETSDMGKSWDGTLNGNKLPMETYVWLIKCFDTNGNEIIRKGNVTMIRD